MRLRAQMTFEFDAVDYIEAAQHQRALEEYLEHINEKYANASLTIKERRERDPDRGTVSLYESRPLSIVK